MRKAAERRRWTLAAWGAAVALVALPVSAATASTGTVNGDARAAAVQAVLDRVLGPGNAVVVVSDTVRTSTASTTSVRWGSGVAGTVGSRVTSVAGVGASTAVVQQHLVGGTRTSTVTPAGALVRQSVSVAVDTAHLGTTKLTTVRRLVAAAVGLTPSRGDRLSVVAARFANPAPAPVPAAPGPLAVLAPYASTILWTLGAVVATGILGAFAGGRRRGDAVARS
ncbi:flagellar M-ring protein FliF C-terminal domain-containing protein [uncultured Amnibacterium sp.]|uniref:flagellar M-ring protein FliF C-terminal domain-containing protein n=1 Tax=uncultured Amnibacterium sp. TaxID=1631851 RepID=UPI0035CBC7DD